MERQLEGAFLYKEGYAPLILFTLEHLDLGDEYLAAHGVAVETPAERAKRDLVRFGIPASAFLIPPDLHDNTAQEAATLARLAVANRWKTVIVVSSGYHTRRAGFAFERALRGTNVKVIMRPSRFDDGQPATWWRSRSDIRWLLSEVPKMATYLAGLGE